MPYPSKPPAKKPGSPNSQARPPRPGMMKPSMPKLNKPDFSNMTEMLPTKPAGATSTTKKVKSFMKKYGQA